MRNAKKTVVVIALIALMAIPSMFAYFTDSKSDENTFTMGNVGITLSAVDVEDGSNVVPGQKIDDAATVTVNEGSNDAYVFVKVTATDDTFNYTLPSDSWKAVGDTAPGVYVYAKGDAALTAVEPGEANAVQVYEDVYVVNSLANDDTGSKEFSVYAYAIQSDLVDENGAAITTAADVWAATNF